MAAVLSQWEQTGIYDPLNPYQKNYIYYTGIPGGYGSFYYNRVPTTAQLHGLGVATSDWLTALIVAAVGVGAGFFGFKYGSPVVKKLTRRRRR